MIKNHELICKVEKIANGKAMVILETEGNPSTMLRTGQKIEVYQSVLPKNIKENDKLVLKFFTPDNAQKSQKDLAKNILNEILDIK